MNIVAKEAADVPMPPESGRTVTVTKPEGDDAHSATGTFGEIEYDTIALSEICPSTVTEPLRCVDEEGEVIVIVGAFVSAFKSC